jgi:FXSXX-COOH protein
MGEAEPAFQSDLIDLSGIDLEQLSVLPGSVFVTALRRILQENAEDSMPYAGFVNDQQLGNWFQDGFPDEDEFPGPDRSTGAAEGGRQ